MSDVIRHSTVNIACDSDLQTSVLYRLPEKGKVIHNDARFANKIIMDPVKAGTTALYYSLFHYRKQHPQIYTRPSGVWGIHPEALVTYMPGPFGVTRVSLLHQRSAAISQTLRHRCERSAQRDLICTPTRFASCRRTRRTPPIREIMVAYRASVRQVFDRLERLVVWLTGKRQVWFSGSLVALQATRVRVGGSFDRRV